MKRFLLCFVFLFFCVQSQAATFAQWKATLQNKLVAQGHDAAWVRAVLGQVQFDPRVVRLDRQQPEGRMTFVTYVTRTVTPQRVAQGRRLLARHKALLQRIEKTYGVPPEILVALWGKETHYGGYTGSFHTLSALASLAYEGRRRDLFEAEFIAAVALLKKQRLHVADLRGSWAGAVGQCQFMPSNYLRFGVDGDRDGRIDLWHSLPDIFASMANLLQHEGWQRGTAWGYKVPTGKTVKLRPNQQFYQPDGLKGPKYVITTNFDVLKRWNRSGYFATAVGRLADALSLSQP